MKLIKKIINLFSKKKPLNKVQNELENTQFLYGPPPRDIFVEEDKKDKK